MMANTLEIHLFFLSGKLLTQKKYTENRDGDAKSDSL
jgi:hypothetical protein